MFDILCKLDRGARQLLEICFFATISGRPTRGQHRKPGFATLPSSLVCVGLRSSQQHGADSPELVFGIHLQVPYRKRLRRVIVRHQEKTHPAILFLLFSMAANVNARGFLPARLVAMASTYAGKSSRRIPTALHHWSGSTSGYQAMPTKRPP